MSLRPVVTVHTDGSFLGRSKHGGWAAHLQCNGQCVTICGYEFDSTNNRMEIMGVLKALQMLTEPCDIHLYSDSRYVVNTIDQNWIRGWIKKGWRTATGGPVMNQDLWEQLWELLKVHRVHANWVRGHNGDPLNEFCDSVSRNMAMDPQRYTYLPCLQS